MGAQENSGKRLPPAAARKFGQQFASQIRCRHLRVGDKLCGASRFGPSLHSARSAEAARGTARYT
jgi:hypothetical protein